MALAVTVGGAAANVAAAASSSRPAAQRTSTPLARVPDRRETAVLRPYCSRLGPASGLYCRATSGRCRAAPFIHCAYETNSARASSTVHPRASSTVSGGPAMRTNSSTVSRNAADFSVRATRTSVAGNPVRHERTSDVTALITGPRRGRVAVLPLSGPRCLHRDRRSTVTSRRAAGRWRRVGWEEKGPGQRNGGVRRVSRQRVT